jgi:hypothetical protein
VLAGSGQALEVAGVEGDGVAAGRIVIQG